MQIRQDGTWITDQPLQQAGHSHSRIWIHGMHFYQSDNRGPVNMAGRATPREIYSTISTNPLSHNRPLFSAHFVCNPGGLLETPDLY